MNPLDHKSRRWWRKGLVLCLALIMAISCRDEHIALSTTDDVNITGYLQEHPEQFSVFTKVLERTGTEGFLGAYGAYTCFAPTNEAFETFLAARGLADVSALEDEALLQLVRFHLITDTISTQSFTDGKLSRPTMHGQYLITGARFSEGVTRIEVNRQADVIEGNVAVGNGIIHVIDHVLEYATFTAGQLIEQMQGYDIFNEALKETHLYDTLNKVSPNNAETKHWYSVIAQTDEDFLAAGFEDYQALKAAFNNTGDPANPDDSLYLFMAYHVLDGLKYLADIVVSPSHTTLAPREVITTKLEGESLLLNEEVFNGVLEPGVAFVREASDYSAVNGVVHTVDGHYKIKVRLPMPVYFDVAEQPELIKNTSQFRVPGSGPIYLPDVAPEDITWEGGGSADVFYDFAGYTSSDPYVYGDFIYVYLRTAVVKWIEFKTPLIVKGRYKVWVCMRRVNGGVYQGFLDDEPLPRTFTGSDYYPSSLTEGEAEAQGFKWYTVNQRNTTYARLLGAVDIETTDRHRLKLIALDNTRGGVNIDMIQFIPVDQDQQWPRFNRDGSAEQKPE